MCSDYCIKALRDQRDYDILCEHIRRNYAILWGLLVLELPSLKEWMDEHKGQDAAPTLPEYEG